MMRPREFYEAAVTARQAWSASPAPAWEDLSAGERVGWEWVAGTPNASPAEHCFDPLVGPRRIEWSDRMGTWAHTDGHPCPDSAARPVPDTAELRMF